MNIGKRWLTIAAAVALLCGMSVTASATTVGFENDHCLVIATEPGATSEHVGYYQNGKETPHESLKWVDDGVHGQALVLDGSTEYLQIGYEQLEMSQMTFSTWINYQGTTMTGDISKRAFGPRLFTIESGEDCYFTVSPHAQCTAITDEVGHLDGIYMEYFRGDEEENYSAQTFTGAIPGKSHFGLPQNEWHHMAVVVDTTTIRLYVDTNLVLEEPLMMPIIQMSADSMIIGGGIWGDPLLGALVDDMMLFDRALTVQEIAALMQTGDVASLKNPAAAIKPNGVYIPTTTVTTAPTTTPTEQPADKPSAPFGLPVWGFGVCAGVLAFFLFLTVIVNAYEISFRRPPKVKKPKQDETQPEEEREQFLTQEQMQKEKANDKEGDGE